MINLVDDEDEEGPKARKPGPNRTKISKRLVVSDDDDESQEALRIARKGGKLGKTTNLVQPPPSPPTAAARRLPANSQPKKINDPHPSGRAKRASAVAASAKCAVDLLDSDDVPVDADLQLISKDVNPPDETADVFGPRVPLRKRDPNATLPTTTASAAAELLSRRDTVKNDKRAEENVEATQKKRKDRTVDDHSEDENPRKAKRAREQVTEEAVAISKTVPSSVSRPPARYGHRGRKAKPSSGDAQLPSDPWDEVPNGQATEKTKTARSGARARPATKSSKQKENIPTNVPTKSIASPLAPDVSMR